MFVESLNKIFESVSKAKKPESAYKLLESKIIASNKLKRQYEAYVILQENAGKLTSKKEVENIKNLIKEKVENNQVLVETKKLLEFFKVEVPVKESLYDKALALNESALNKILISEKVLYKNSLFKHIVKEGDDKHFDKQARIVDFLAEAVKGDKKDLIKKSVEVLKEEKYKDFTKAANKLYKLRGVTEETLKESEVVKKLKSLNYVKNPQIEFPNSESLDKVVLYFDIPVWPIGITVNSARTNAIKVRDKIERLERLFINKLIYQKPERLRYFDPKGTIWQTLLRLQVAVGQGVNARVEVYLNTNRAYDGQNTMKDFMIASQDLLTDFDVVLPELMGDLQDVLTPTAQKEKLKAAKKMSIKDRRAQEEREGAVDTKLLRRSVGQDEFNYTQEDDFGGAF